MDYFYSMKKKCLIVCDDDTDILEVTTMVLEKQGYKVIPLKNCDDYLKVIGEVRPDLILMDIWMPKQTGDVITKLIKTDKKYKNIPIVLCSANMNIEDVA